MKKLLLLLVGLFIFVGVEAQIHTYYRHKDIDTNRGTTQKAERIEILRLVITYDYCYECDEYGNRKSHQNYDMDSYLRVRNDENGNTIYRAKYNPFICVVSADKSRVNKYWDNPSVRHLITVYDKQKPTFDDIIMY